MFSLSTKVQFHLAEYSTNLKGDSGFKFVMSRRCKTIHEASITYIQLTCKVCLRMCEQADSPIDLRESVASD